MKDGFTVSEVANKTARLKLDEIARAMPTGETEEEMEAASMTILNMISEMAYKFFYLGLAVAQNHAEVGTALWEGERVAADKANNQSFIKSTLALAADIHVS